MEKMDWNQKFENKENLLAIFIDKVLGLVTNLKDFDRLFNLLNTSSSNNVIEISPSTLEKIQIKFIELCKVFDFNKNKDLYLNNIIISIITYSKNEKKEEFLKIIKDILNEDKIKEIYTILLSEKRSILNEVII